LFVTGKEDKVLWKCRGMEKGYSWFSFFFCPGALRPHAPAPRKWNWVELCFFEAPNLGFCDFYEKAVRIVEIEGFSVTPVLFVED
jgi:hypothetical protein